MGEYLNTRTTPVPLASGRLVAPGDPCDPDTNNPHDQALIDEHALVPVDNTKPRKTAEKEA